MPERMLYYGAAIGATVLILCVQLLQPPSTRKKKSLRRKADPKQDDLDPSIEWTSKAIQEKIPGTGDAYLVLGAGALGKRILRALILRGERRLRIADISQEMLDSIEPKDAKFVEKVKVDVRHKEDLTRACSGMDCVFSTFAIIRYYERWDSQMPLSYSINVDGIRNTIQACIEAKVSRLIHTSSSAVCQVADGSTMGLEMDESSPVCTMQNRYNNYSYTKMLGEKLVLEANGEGEEAQLATGVIRPCCSVIGYGDRYTMENMFKGKAASLLYTDYTQDYVPVDNVVLGCLLLEKELRNQGVSGGVAGDVFCISNDEPISAEDFVDLACDIDKEMTVVQLPVRVLWFIAYIVELLSLTPLHRRIPSQLRMLTPVTLSQVSYAYKSAKARKALGYAPLLTTEQGLKRALREYRHEKMILSVANDLETSERS